MTSGAFRFAEGYHLWSMEPPAKKMKTMDTNVDLQSTPPQNKKLSLSLNKKNDCLLKVDTMKFKSRNLVSWRKAIPQLIRKNVQNGPSKPGKSNNCRAGKTMF